MNVGIRRYVEHLWGPTVSVVLHLLVVILLLRLVLAPPPEEDDAVTIDLVNETVMEWDDVPDFPPPPEFESVDTPVDPAEATLTEIEAPAVDEPLESTGVDMDTGLRDVLPATGPLILRTEFGGRSARGREQALEAFARGAGGATEPAVRSALRWLKGHQQADGSWLGTDRSAMTGLALLAFLAHGETTSSAEYGETVGRAMRYLLRTQDAGGRLAKNVYAHAIGAYALSEAFGLMRIPALKGPMERAVAIIVQGQRAGGGWDYDYKQEGRRDTSVSGWQIQALKAARIAGAEVAGLDAALERASADLASAQDSRSGLFVYSGIDGRRSEGLTGVGVLCLQLLGHGAGREARLGIQSLQGMTCDWTKAPEWALYGWYYITQAKFHHGSQTWSAWNQKFARTFVRNQNEDGSWTAPGNERDQGPVYSTALGALTLQVYYRNLPTYRAAAAEPVRVSESDDVEVRVL